MLTELVSKIRCETAVRDLVFWWKYLLRLQSDVQAAHSCHTWLSEKWLQLVVKGGVKQGPCQHRPSSFEVNFAPWLHVFLCVCLWGRERQSKSLLLPHQSHSSSPDEQRLKPSSSFCFFLHLPFFYSSTLPHSPLFLPSSLSLPLFQHLPLALCLFFRPPPHVRKSLLPVSAGKLFCPPIPCFHYLV